METVVEPSVEERAAARSRPAGRAVMYQSWGKLLFLHWQIPVDVLRKKIPADLAIDTHEGAAWVGVTPFTMWGIRPAFLPALPYFSQAHELNVRTYVRHGGVPGVWFFSLDINNLPAVPAARLAYRLPYHYARIHMRQAQSRIDYHLRRRYTFSPGSRRADRGRCPALDASWTIGERLPESKPGTIEYFLTERYSLYTARHGHLYRADIWHEPWPLCAATLHSLESSMLESHDLPTPQAPPLLHYAGAIDVEIWPLRRIT